MNLITAIILFIYSCITANATGKVLSPPTSNSEIEGVNGEANSELVIGDRLICNQIECYPKVFEASNEWQEVRPEQRLPAGLDIRIDLETGKKEAKMLDLGSSSQNTPEVTTPSIIDEGTVAEEHTDTEPDEAPFKWNDISEEENDSVKTEVMNGLEKNIPEEDTSLEVENETFNQSGEQSEDKDLIIDSSSNADNDKKSEYEFAAEFEKIKRLEKLSSDESWDQVEMLLDDLVEYSHDYSHGFKIISNEFELLYRLSFSQEIPVEVRELAARIIVSSLRNNPPSIDYINENYPETLLQICKELPALHASKVKILVKRFLSILDVLLARSSDPEVDEKVLWSLYSSNDSLIKIKVLEIVSKLYHQNNLPFLERHSEDLSTVQAWANELAHMVQSKDIDEYQLRSFFNSVHHLKKYFGSKIKVDSDFLNWLIDEVEFRKEKQSDEVYKRDIDQIEFDAKLIESRHDVFGNQKASRIKQFDGEELVNDEL